MTVERPEYAPLRPCKNRAGFETLPGKPLRLDLEELESRIKSSGNVEMVGNAGVLLLARTGGVDFSIFDSGKLLFKTKDAEEAEGALRAFEAAMGWV